MVDCNRNACKEALPRWIKDRENEVNTCVELVCNIFGYKDSLLRVGGASFYQVYFDDALVHFGPARKAHGYSSIDELPVPAVTDKVIIRAVGYNCPTFNGVFQSSFIMAELENDKEVFAATGKGGFECYENLQHIQKTVRYSFQRQFTESWNMTRKLKTTDFDVVDPKVEFSLRDVPYAEFTKYKANQMYLKGTWTMEETYRYPLRYWIKDHQNIVHFSHKDLESNAYDEWLKIKTSYEKTEPNRNLSAQMCGLWDLGIVIAGFLHIKLITRENTRIILSFSEQIDEEYSLYVKEFNTINLIEWTLPAGEWNLRSFEPYTARFMEILVMEGEVEVEFVGIDEFAFPASKIITSAPEDLELKEIYEAAVRTFRHNVIDIYMDCPSRERAGWLFDSFYTGKAEMFFTGEVIVEKAFLENYVKGGEVSGTPGMVEMIYPGDVVYGQFIPQWAMWYALEICDYITERCETADKTVFEQQMCRLIEYFDKFKNEYGLLERLENFNFVEWSDLNNRVLDVSWPTNMLYAKMLERLGTVYGHDSWIEQSHCLNQTICKMAYDGKIFCDRAVRNEYGKLENTEERSETTQYYALFLGTADADEIIYNSLRKMVHDVFTTLRFEEYPNILKSEIFMGIYLKIDVLLNMNMPDKALDVIKANFLPMARESGTLWEHLSGYKSRDHGFASYAAVAIDKALRLKAEGKCL